MATHSFSKGNRCDKLCRRGLIEDLWYFSDHAVHGYFGRIGNKIAQPPLCDRFKWIDNSFYWPAY